MNQPSQRREKSPTRAVGDTLHSPNGSVGMTVKGGAFTRLGRVILERNAMERGRKTKGACACLESPNLVQLLN